MAVKHLRALLAVVVLSAGLFAGGAVVAPEAEARSGTYATCRYGTTALYYTGNPRACRSGYTLYHNGRRVLFIRAGTQNGPGIWNVMGEGYRAVNRWCSRNSFTCGVVTSIGVALVTPLVSSATS